MEDNLQLSAQRVLQILKPPNLPPRSSNPIIESKNSRNYIQNIQEYLLQLSYYQKYIKQEDKSIFSDEINRYKEKITNELKQQSQVEPVKILNDIGIQIDQLHQNIDQFQKYKRVLVISNDQRLPINLIQQGNADQDDEFECPICDDNLSSKDTLIDHLKQSHFTCYNYTNDDKKFKANYQVIKDPQEDFDLVDNLNAQQIYLINNQIMQTYQFNQIDEGWKENISKIKSELKQSLQRMYPEAELKSYGSFKSGFGDKSSDIDLTINIDWEAYVFKSEHEFKRLLDIFSSQEVINLAILVIFSRIIDGLIEEGFDKGRLEFIRTGKRSSLKLKFPITQIDLLVNNQIAYLNTKLLQTYGLIDERVRILGITIKHWAKQRDIANTRNGTLSSYAYILLMLYYLIYREEMLPNLQKEEDLEVQNIAGYNASFCRDYNRFKALAQLNTKSVAELLYSFFKHIVELNFDQIITINNNLLEKNEFQNQKKNRIQIIDPFEPDRDLGDTIFSKGNGDNRIISEFRRAALILSNGQLFSDVLDN